jgi:iron complex outermembrane recepter protein
LRAIRRLGSVTIEPTDAVTARYNQGEGTMFTRTLGRAAFIGLLMAGAMASPSQLMAQDGAARDDGTIVVTAQRREQNSVEVPISITSLSSEQMETANVDSLSDISKITPGLRFDSQGPSVQPTIRGVGTAITTSGGGPNVGIYVDGFFQPNTYLFDFEMTKTESIQVLKGPQGTLFGRNTTGGAILVTTADPSTTPAFEAQIGYGSFNSMEVSAYGTTGITDTIAMDVEYRANRGDGYFTDLATGSDTIGQYDSWSIRAGLKAELGANTSVMLRFVHAETDNPTTQLVNAYVDADGGAGFFSQLSAAGRTAYGQTSSAGLPLVYYFTPATARTSNPRDVILNGPTSFKTNSDGVFLTIATDLGFADLTSYTQYRRDKSPYFGDLDAMALPFFNIFVGVDDETWSQEFVLTSKGDGPLQWTAGGNYFSYRDTWDVDASFNLSPFFGFGGSSTTTKSFAAFVDMTYGVTDTLFVTLGGRYSNDSVDDAYFTTNPFTASYIGPTGLPVPVTVPPGTQVPVAKLTNDSFIPRVVVRYQPSDVMSVYASFTKGFKGGILNVGGLSQLPVEPEKINAYEFGFKYDNRVVSFDLAGFYYDYSNLQVSSFQSGAAQIRNAASSEIYGLEAQARFRVTDAFQIYGGGSWTHARYKSFTNAPFYSYCDPTLPVTNSLSCLTTAAGIGSIVQTTIDASGFKMQRSPDFTGNLGASYTADVGGGAMVLSGNFYYTSSFYFDPEQQFKQDGYELLSLRAAWTDSSDTFTLAVFGDNVTGTDYRAQVLFNTLGISSVWAAPATWGVQAGVKF